LTTSNSPPRSVGLAVVSSSLAAAQPGCTNAYEGFDVGRSVEAATGSTGPSSSATTGAVGPSFGGGGAGGVHADGGGGAGAAAGSAGNGGSGGIGEGTGGSTSAGAGGAGGATITCADKYTGQTFCAEDATQCEVIFADTQSCNVWCALYGGTCLGAWDNVPAGSCTFDSNHTCDSVGYFDLVCVCTL